MPHPPIRIPGTTPFDGEQARTACQNLRHCL